MPAVVVLVVVLITTSGGDKPRLPPPAALPQLLQTFASNSIGVSGQIPTDWSAIKGRGFVRLRSRDGRAEILIASPGVTYSASQLVATALATIHKSYTKVTVKRGPGQTLGGLPVKSRVVYARNARGVSLRILVAGARGKRLNYLLEAFTATHAPLHALVEAQEIVIALHLTG